jgi:hypothetical protein
MYPRIDFESDEFVGNESCLGEIRNARYIRPLGVG